MVGCPILRALCEGWGTRPLEGATTTLGRGGSDYTTRSWGWQKQGPGQRAAGPY
jgi:hypothetical protein